METLIGIYNKSIYISKPGDYNINIFKYRVSDQMSVANAIWSNQHEFYNQRLRHQGIKNIYIIISWFLTIFYSLNPYKFSSSSTVPC